MTELDVTDEERRIASIPIHRMRLLEECGMMMEFKTEHDKVERYEDKL